ncbi:MAG: restriction endonuclease, partial [Myxococcota bacterium]|nr:restriction endonuclease [Myxococcota bacterium]
LGRDIGALPSDTDRAMLAERFRMLHPTWRHGRHRGAAAQLWSFVHEIEPGDKVLTYDATERRYFLGTVRSAARYEAAPPVDLPFRRDVDWTHRVERDHLPTTTRNALNILQTLFGVQGAHAAAIEAAAITVDAPPGTGATHPGPTPPDAAGPSAWTAPRAAAPQRGRGGPPPDATAAPPAPVIRLPRPPRILDRQAASPTPPSASGRPTEAGEPGIEDLRARVEEQADQLIEARLAALPASGIKALVAGVLAAMGYPRRQPEGHASSGCDLYAAPNVLGLQEPMLHVRIEHRPDTPVDAARVATLAAAVPADARVLLVSTGGFTRAARERAQPTSRAAHLTLLDMAELRRTLLDHYERLDLETRSLVPLTRIYWPAR